MTERNNTNPLPCAGIRDAFGRAEAPAVVNA